MAKRTSKNPSGAQKKKLKELLAAPQTERSLKIPEGRVPPQALDAEESVLGCILLDGKTMIRVGDILRPEDFYKKEHRVIYQAMLTLFSRTEAIDILSVANFLKEESVLDAVGGNAYLASLVNSVPTPAHALHYAKIVKRKKALRDLIDASHAIAELGWSESEDIDKLLDEAEQRIFAISQRTLTQEFMPVSNILGETYERIEKLSQHEDGTLRGTPTGFVDLDNKLSGLNDSDLILLAARPSIGKTSFALDVARHVAVNEKKPVGIFSLEMSQSQVVDRLLAAEGKVNTWRLRSGRLSSEDFERLRDALDRLSRAPLFIDDSPTITALQMRTLARRLQAEHGLSLIIVDYLQLVESTINSDSMVQQVTEISRSLKAMARELNVPVLALSQLSRAVESRPNQIPRLSDLRESGCLTGDTLLMRADTGERIPIKNLVGKTNIPVYSLNEKTWKIEPRRISKVFPSGKKKVFALTTRSGRTIKASANHPFRVLGGWKRLDELSTKEHIALPRMQAPKKPRSNLSDDELILLAHLIGDGCVLPRQPVHYTSADPKNISIVSQAAQNLFDITPRVVQQKNWWHVYLPSPYRLTHNRRHPITRWFEKLGIERVRSYRKKLPDALFTCDTPQIRLFLHHLWATDGSILWKRLRGRKPATSIYYATTSKTLAEQIQHLLVRLEIKSTMRTVTKGNYRPGYQLHIQGAASQLRFLKEVGCYGDRGKTILKMIQALEKIAPNPNTDIIPKDAWRTLITAEKERAQQSWRDLSANIDTAYCGNTLFKSGLSRQRMQRVAKALNSAPLMHLATSDVYWDEIVSIEPLGAEEVFDATVPETHNFIANDIIVHNSLEQDSDVVMFIWREDKVKPDTPNKGVTEIQIAKHRNGPTGKVMLRFDEEHATFWNLDRVHEAPDDIPDF